MKSQWQNKSLERSKPLKKLSLKHKLSSSKEKHKFTNSLMAVSEWQQMQHTHWVHIIWQRWSNYRIYLCVSAGLGHYKNRAEKPRPADGSITSAVLNASRLEGQAVCKTERLQTLSTPLGPYDKSYSRKRLREHSLDRSDCESLLPGGWFRNCRCIKISQHWMCLSPAASPKLFLDSSSLCPSLANIHSSLHSPLTRQLSTSSENATPLGTGSQSIPSTPVREQVYLSDSRCGDQLDPAQAAHTKFFF